MAVPLAVAALLAIVAELILQVGQARATHVTPLFISFADNDNPTCGDFGSFIEFKLEPTSNGTFNNGDGLEVTISI